MGQKNIEESPCEICLNDFHGVCCLTSAYNRHRYKTKPLSPETGEVVCEAWRTWFSARWRKVTADIRAAAEKELAKEPVNE